MRTGLWTLAVVAFAAAMVACGDSGPEAPAVGAVEMYCGANFCVDYPQDWTVVDSADDYVTLAHPADPEGIVATVGQTGMAALVEAAGSAWPQPPIEVARSFWGLIDDGGAQLDTIEVRNDGSVASFGSYGGGHLWYRLVPLSGDDAIAVEVRAPNTTWSAHALAITDSLQPLG